MQDTSQAMLPSLSGLRLSALRTIDTATNKRPRDLTERELLEEALSNAGMLIDALVERVDLIKAVPIFCAYVACCLYADGFDYPINEFDEIESAPDDELVEFLETQEVSLRGIHVANLLRNAQEQRHCVEIERVMTTKFVSPIEYSSVTVAQLRASAVAVRIHLEYAFEAFGVVLQEPMDVYSGFDEPDRDDDAPPTFEWKTPFLSTSISYDVALLFAESQMGIVVGGGVWKLQLQPGSKVLPLTSRTFDNPIVRSRWVETTSVMEEEEILLRRELSAGHKVKLVETQN